MTETKCAELAAKIRDNTKWISGLVLCVQTERTSGQITEAIENLHDIADELEVP